MQTVLCNCILPLLIGRGKDLPAARRGSQAGCPQRIGEGRASCWGSRRIFNLHSKVLNSSIVWSGEGLVVLSERWNPEFLPREAYRFYSSLCHLLAAPWKRGAALCFLTTNHRQFLWKTFLPSLFLVQPGMNHRNAWVSMGRESL